MIRAAGVVIALAGVGSCGQCGADSGGDDLRPSPAASSSAFEPIASATPARTFYLEKNGERCVIFSALGSDRSAESPARCPREVTSGERLRLSGQTCMRESSDAARNLPVRCPKWLIRAARGEPG